MKEYTKIKNGRQYTVRLFENGLACTFDQPINPKTGKGWQATKNSERFDNHVKAMWAWCKK